MAAPPTNLEFEFKNLAPKFKKQDLKKKKIKQRQCNLTEK
jgi:hypothetical protein